MIYSLAYYRSKSKFNLNSIHFLQQLCSASKPFKKLFIYYPLHLRWKKIYDLSNFFSSFGGSQLRRIRRVLHKFEHWSRRLSRQFAIYVLAHCLVKRKPSWRSFCVYYSLYFRAFYLIMPCSYEKPLFR